MMMNTAATFATPMVHHPIGPLYTTTTNGGLATSTLPTWVVPLLVFLFIIVAAYFLYRIAMCVERISDSASKVIDSVSDVAEPTVGGFKSLLSALCDVGSIASAAAGAAFN